MPLIQHRLSIFRQKKILIPLFFILVIIIVRIIAPTAVRLGLNNYLKDFSPTLIVSVGDVDLSIIRGVYTLENIRGVMKNKGKVFLQVDKISAYFAWKDILKGNLITNVYINNLDLNYSDGLVPAIKETLTQMKQEEKDENKTFPVKVERMDLKNSVIRTDLFPSLTKEQGIILTDLDVQATNLTPTKQRPNTSFSMKAQLLKSGKMTTEGKAMLLKGKTRWSIDSEIKSFDLTSLNRFLKKKVPLTFSKGNLDLYAEAKSDGGPIEGYFKPFVKGLDVIKSKEDFEGPKHWLVEIITALGNVVMKEDETMATKVPFIFDKKLRPDKDETISNAFKHGFRQELKRGLDHSISLEKTPSKQSQEE